MGEIKYKQFWLFKSNHYGSNRYVYSGLAELEKKITDHKNQYPRDKYEIIHVINSEELTATKKELESVKADNQKLSEQLEQCAGDLRIHGLDSIRTELEVVRADLAVANKKLEKAREQRNDVCRWYFAIIEKYQPHIDILDAQISQITTETLKEGKGE